MGKCCFDILKFLVFIITFLCFICVSGLLGVFIYVLLRAEDILGYHISTDLSADNPTAVHFSFLLIFIVLSGFLTLFSFLGCCGAACQSRCMLGSFIIILFVFLGGYIGGIVYIFITFPDELQMVTSELEKTIPYYQADDPESLVRKFWDWIQPTLQCCGVTSWQDWQLAETGLKQSRVVPASCCKKTFSDSTPDCVYHPDDENAFLIGCFTKIEFPFRVVFWAIPSAMAFVLVSAICLCSGLNRQEPMEGETLSPRRKFRPNRNSRNGNGNEIERTGYVYQSTPAPNYPTAPPYNPDYPTAPGQGNQYGYHDTTESYPTGVIPPHCQPLIQPPPPYHEVINR